MIATIINLNDIKLLNPCSVCGLACLECKRICYDCEKLFSCRPDCEKKAAHNRICFFLYNSESIDTETLASVNDFETSNY
jgi:hypothetical protein